MVIQLFASGSVCWSTKLTDLWGLLQVTVHCSHSQFLTALALSVLLQSEGIFIRSFSANDKFCSKMAGSKQLTEIVVFFKKTVVGKHFLYFADVKWMGSEVSVLETHLSYAAEPY